jgi:hypothetical protein
MDTITEVQVDELWTSTVNITPIISPTTGFVRSSLFWKMEPVKEEDLFYTDNKLFSRNS